VLREEFRGKTVFSVSDLYRLVTPPGYVLPEVETPDLLVTGIVAQKSSVRQVRGRDDGGNYMVVKITDLKVHISFRGFEADFGGRWTLICFCLGRPFSGRGNYKRARSSFS
jgi:hypothetical protein